MLVRDAIGFVPTRGDTVSVVNLPFSNMEVAVDKNPINGLINSLTSADLLSQLLRYLAIAAAVLFVWFALVKPFMRGRKSDAVPIEPVLTPGLDPTARQMQALRDKEGALVAQRQAWMAEDQRRDELQKEDLQRHQENEVARKKQYDGLVAYLQQYVAQEPAKAALQLRAWAGEPQQNGAAKNSREMERS